MDAEAGAPLLGGAGPHSFSLRATFCAPLAALLAVVLALLAAFGEYAPDLDDAHVARYYPFLTDVCCAHAWRGSCRAPPLHACLPAHASACPAGPQLLPRHARPQVYAMIFLGFGLLMTFLRRYSLSAVALNFLLSAVVMLEALLCCGWAQQGWGAVALDLPLLTDACFAAGAAMIAFGALLGKATPAQLLGVLAAQAPLYAATAQLVGGRWAALDIGGSITIHAFGAAYGLAASVFLTPKGGAGAGAAHPKNSASRASDLSAMLGTLFLFIYW